ncbi:MAG: OmpH family outer membrane protein [Janthinobacterium lividum]
MKKLHLTFAAVLLAAGSFFAPSAHAQQKIGFTSVEYVLSQMPESKQIESDLKTYGSQLEAQLKTKQADFDTKLKKYQQDAQAPGGMTDIVKRDREKELQTMQQGLQEFSQTAQQSMQQRQQTALKPVLDKIQKTIDTVADENGYSYILNSDSGSNPVLLHGPKDGDVSDIILKKMGITPTAPSAGAGGTVRAPNQQTGTNVPPAPIKPKPKTK